jgi:C-terminal peptidase prc
MRSCLARRPAAFALVLLAVLLLGETPARAEPARSARREAIARIIEQMGSISFQRREMASAILELLDTAALPALQRAADSHPDAEVRRRAALLVESITSQHAEVDQFAARALEIIDLACESSVTEASREEWVRQAVRALFQQTLQPLPPDLLERARDLQDRPGKTDRARALLWDTHWAARPPGTPEVVLDRTISGMLRSLDPHASWGEPTRLITEVIGNPVGVGLCLEKDAATDMIRVVTPVRNSPAHRAGIRAGDLLTHVTRLENESGKPLVNPEMVCTKGLSVSQAVRTILGPRGTRVALTIHREGGRILNVHVRRAGVTVETVVGWRLGADDEWDYWLDPRRKIACIRLTAFGRDSERDLKAVLDRLEQQGMRGLVLDLRFNPGGLLDRAVKIADLLIDDGLIVRLTLRGGNPSPLRAGRRAAESTSLSSAWLTGTARVAPRCLPPVCKTTSGPSSWANEPAGRGVCRTTCVAATANCCSRQASCCGRMARNSTLVANPQRVAPSVTT